MLVMCYWLIHLYRALSVILYLAFLFVVVIILLNVLIAQMSDTYAKVRTVARDVFLLYQCYYLAKIENQKLANCLLYFFRHLFLNNCHDRKCCVSYTQTCMHVCQSCAHAHEGGREGVREGLTSQDELKCQNR